MRSDSKKKKSRNSQLNNKKSKSTKQTRTQKESLRNTNKGKLKGVKKSINVDNFFIGCGKRWAMLFEMDFTSIYFYR
jgi:glutamine cyclotransferase